MKPKIKGRPGKAPFLFVLLNALFGWLPFLSQETRKEFKKAASHKNYSKHRSGKY